MFRKGGDRIRVGRPVAGRPWDCEGFMVHSDAPALVLVWLPVGRRRADQRSTKRSMPKRRRRRRPRQPAHEPQAPAARIWGSPGGSGADGDIAVMGSAADRCAATGNYVNASPLPGEGEFTARFSRQGSGAFLQQARLLGPSLTTLGSRGRAEPLAGATGADKR